MRLLRGKIDAKLGQLGSDANGIFDLNCIRDSSFETRTSIIAVKSFLIDIVTSRNRVF